MIGFCGLKGYKPSARTDVQFYQICMGIVYVAEILALVFHSFANTSERSGVGELDEQSVT